ncbi:MAG: chorismate synthase [Gallionellales bacterium RIFCSPLOWO2_12_FULL_59_22]|nr:MAG: chorismate synthase [Gallionellales bacterium RIFCSPLOWO2_12_FULL_59_22]
MSGNTFGTLFTVTSFGESHGAAIGCIVDGCPPGMSLGEADIQHDLDRRKPGMNRFVTQRRESDTVEILSGVFDGKTTGTPIALLIRNEDQRSKDYGSIAETFRPGHADYTYWQKYGVTVRGYLTQLGEIAVPFKSWDDVGHNPFFAPNADVVQSLEDYMDALRKSGDSIGARLAVVAHNVPVGWGEPVFDRLDAEIAYALMSINAVKAVEIGAGFACVTQKGSEHGDELTPNGFLSNNAGGILGGISTGQDIVAHYAVKPTSSIRLSRHSINKAGEAVDVSTEGRHDPCVGIRATPIAEAMLALVLIDHALRHRGQNGDVVCGTPKLR